MQYGNGTEMTYSYEPERRRLQHLTAATSKNRSIMNNTYGYDAVDNIMSLTNAAAPASPNQQGGPAAYTYQYDDLYRLVSSTGRFQSGNGQEHAYNFAMEYSPSGNILKKNQQHQVKGSIQGKTSYDFAYKYEGDKPHAASAIGNNRYVYDLNGNPTLIAETNKNQERRMAWDEENRLLALADNGKSYHYMYDAGGERIIKGKGDGQLVSVNGFNPAGVGFTGNYSMYVNAYLVVNGSRYTKHFYMEGQRVASKISERSIDKELAELKVGSGTGTGNNGNGGVDYDKKHKLSKEALYAAYIAAGMQPEISTAGKSGKIPYGQLKKYFELGSNNGNNGNGNGNSGSTSTGKYENLQFFYHPDHLGSSNYITDASGEVYQHNEYFPYGETFVEERNGTEYTNYLFSGKELDVETGLYYFGARYQDPRTSVFINLDPLMDKYPGISPYIYIYCLGSPIRFEDPDGNTPKERQLALATAKALIGLAYKSSLPQNERVKDGQLDCSGLVRYSMMQNTSISEPFNSKGNGVTQIMNSSRNVEINCIRDGDLVIIKSGNNENGHVGFVKDIIKDSNGNVIQYTMLHSESAWTNSSGQSGGGFINETIINVGSEKGFAKSKYNHRFYQWDTQGEDTPSPTSPVIDMDRSSTSHNQTFIGPTPPQKASEKLQRHRMPIIKTVGDVLEGLGL